MPHRTQLTLTFFTVENLCGEAFFCGLFRDLSPIESSSKSLEAESDRIRGGLMLGGRGRHGGICQGGGQKENGKLVCFPQITGVPSLWN